MNFVLGCILVGLLVEGAAIIVSYFDNKIQHNIRARETFDNLKRNYD
jgi:hypothetical protein